MRYFLLLATHLLLRFSLLAQPQPGTYNVRTYGATGNGKALDTSAINKAIGAAAAAGGGTVYFPAGAYASFSVRLQSNITLFLDQGATLLAADPPADGTGGYDAPEPTVSDKFQDFGHSHWHNSLIWGENLVNVAILGPGLIHGKGLTRGGSPKPGVGNKAIALKLCRNVLIRDVTVLYGGHFGILATGLDNFTVDNVKMDTNRDGIDVDCCRHVRISNCTINSPWDDAICLKSSYALGFPRATENVTITNCQVTGYDRGTFYDGTYQRREAALVPDKMDVTGRIKFGTESNGGFRNITIANCVFEYCRGLALETVDGGLLEDVTITNLTMRDIVNAPLFLRLGARLRGPEGTPAGALRRVHISNVVVSNADPKYGCIISGIAGHAIEDVTLDNIRIEYQGGGTAAQAAIVPPEAEKDYPDPGHMGEMPAYGFFIRHVQGLEMRNIDIRYQKEDQRPPFVLVDVQGISLRNIKAQHPATVPAFTLQSVAGFSIRDSELLADKQVKQMARGKL
ncbi:MAG: right-handed parallel beta-helix repeat-containing protein [Hymenobacter sp.]|nr:right-handed parallel beta-helix repeat-containing protein [Hymenobacter sp.]